MSLSAKYVYNTLIKNDMLYSRSSIYMQKEKKKKKKKKGNKSEERK